MRLILLATIAALLGACSGSGGGNSPAPSAGKTVRFVAFGDAGTGSERQIAVGEAMAEVCRVRGCDFALELGDNFYLSGVESVDDAQFQAKFEIPYAALQLPIYVTLGNHDNSAGPGEGSANRKGDFQVDYHYLAGRTSDKFRMPARYYQFSAGEGLAEFWSLDSNPLTSIVADPDPAWNFLTYGAAQQTWLKEGLRASKARWKIAFAHHPYLSNGLHGNAGTYDGLPAALPLTSNGAPWKTLIEDTLCAEGADLFFQGHDHDLEWIKPVAACGKTHFVVSGAAEGPRPFGDAARNATYWQVDNTLGFFWFELTESQMRGAAYTLGDDLALPRSNGRPVAAFEQVLPKP
ncbi:MAG TPA: metallophosphoesterase [Solimonas sp.]|nr:metallophosphoesterase [Solimonas sp.]